jgi:stage II sporulation protein D
MAFTFKGVGHGHGIGMCQWGARGRAESGQSAEEILSAYYPGAEIVDVRHE